MLTPYVKEHKLKVDYLKKMVRKMSANSELPSLSKQYTVILLSRDLLCCGQSDMTPKSVNDLYEKVFIAFIEQYSLINPQSPEYSEKVAQFVFGLIVDFAKAVIEWNRVSIPAANKMFQISNRAISDTEHGLTPEDGNPIEVLMETLPAGEGYDYSD